MEREGKGKEDEGWADREKKTLREECELLRSSDRPTDGIAARTQMRCTARCVHATDTPGGLDVGPLRQPPRRQ